MAGPCGLNRGEIGHEIVPAYIRMACAAGCAGQPIGWTNPPIGRNARDIVRAGGGVGLRTGVIVLAQAAPTRWAARSFRQSGRALEGKSGSAHARFAVTVKP